MTTDKDHGTVIRIEELVREVDELVSFPEFYLRVSELLEDPNATSQEIGKLLGQDPGLALRVLKIANSPMYGLSRQVETVERAVMVLGKSQIVEVVLATTVSKVIAGIPNDVYDMDDFWSHSILCGIVTRELTRLCRHVDVDFAFVAGLLHDVGQLVLFNRFPGQSRVALELVMDREQPVELFEAERKIFGFDHAMLAGRLMEVWLLPERLRECVEFHHAPALALNHPVEAALVHMANCVTNVQGTELTPERTVERIDRICWDRTGLEPDQLLPIVDAAEEAVDEIRALLLG